MTLERKSSTSIIVHNIFKYALADSIDTVINSTLKMFYVELRNLRANEYHYFDRGWYTFNDLNMKALHEYTHLFFDLDNTLTRSRTVIESGHREVLQQLKQDVAVISGTHHLQIAIQLQHLPVIVMGQTGNHTFSKSGTELWNDVLSPQEEEEILSHISLLRPLLQHEIPNEDDLIAFRGAQISFSILGHTAPVDDKERIDPDLTIRKKLLVEIPFSSKTVDLCISGTTSLNYYLRGRHKGFNVQRLIDYYSWNNVECLYIGDSFYPGGNDEAVIGVIDTHQVSDFRETYELLSMTNR